MKIKDFILSVESELLT